MDKLQDFFEGRTRNAMGNVNTKKKKKKKLIITRDKGICKYLMAATNSLVTQLRESY